MFRLLMLIVAVGVIVMMLSFSMGGMNPFSMVVAIVAIAIFGGILREFAKSKGDVNNAAQKDLVEIKQRLTQIEADIADIKEQIADFIIKQV